MGYRNDRVGLPELVESILGDSGRVLGVEHPVLFEVFDI